MKRRAARNQPPPRRRRSSKSSGARDEIKAINRACLAILGTTIEYGREDLYRCIG